MARRRRLKKNDGGDLEIHKRNVVSSYQVIVEENVIFSNQVIVEQNVTPSKLRPKEQNVASSEMKIEKWCIKQSMWIRVNKDDNL